MFTGVVYLQNERNDKESTVEEEAVEETMEEVCIISMRSFVLAVLCSFIAVFFSYSCFAQPFYGRYSGQPVNLC